MLNGSRRTNARFKREREGEKSISGGFLTQNMGKQCDKNGVKATPAAGSIAIERVARQGKSQSGK